MLAILISCVCDTPISSRFYHEEREGYARVVYSYNTDGVPSEWKIENPIVQYFLVRFVVPILLTQGPSARDCMMWTSPDKLSTREVRQHHPYPRTHIPYIGCPTCLRTPPHPRHKRHYQLAHTTCPVSTSKSALGLYLLYHHESGLVTTISAIHH
jgi:hypothetical protein